MKYILSFIAFSLLTYYFYKQKIIKKNESQMFEVKSFSTDLNELDEGYSSDDECLLIKDE
jgi:hypothetical protein